MEIKLRVLIMIVKCFDKKVVNVDTVNEMEG